MERVFQQGSESNACCLTRRGFLLGIASLAAKAVNGQQQQENPPFQLPDSVVLHQDVVYYSVGGKRPLRVDVFLPKAAGKGRPAVVYIHGGGWRGGTKRQFWRQAAHMATRGYVGACIEYRLSGEAKFPAAVHECKVAVRWLRSKRDEFGIDPERIGAAGGSAGGHLAAMLGTTAQVRELDGPGYQGYSSEIQAVAAFNPVLDLVSWGKQDPEGKSDRIQRTLIAFLGVPYARDPELWRLASPIEQVDKNSAPFLLLHGTKDTTVPYEQSKRMYEKLKALGVYAELFTAEGAGHGFFNRPPWFQPTLERMESFFEKTLR